MLSIIELGNREPIRSVYELAMIISGRCYGAYDRHGVGSEEPHFLDMFEGWIGAAMNDEVKLFNFFKQDSNNASEWVSYTMLCSVWETADSGTSLNDHDTQADLMHSYVIHIRSAREDAGG